jgi:Fe-S oxidoreductase
MGKAVVDVLTANDVEVIIPSEQGCCGIPASVNGDINRARAMAKRNLQAFEKSGCEPSLYPALPAAAPGNIPRPMMEETGIPETC